jgi:predicted kinase
MCDLCESARFRISHAGKVKEMATVHLISGLPCAGKTTYALGLRADSNCVLFTLDRWLITLFGKYSISSAGHEEHTRRVLVCRGLIWETAAEFLRRSVDVVLDDGFFLRENRIRYVDLAHQTGAAVKIHFLDTPISVIHARLSHRNSHLPPFNFYIDRESFQAFIGLFEVPSPDEGAEIVVVKHVNELGPSVGIDQDLHR